MKILECFISQHDSCLTLLIICFVCLLMEFVSSISFSQINVDAVQGFYYSPSDSNHISEFRITKDPTRHGQALY